MQSEAVRANKGKSGKGKKTHSEGKGIKLNN